MAAHGVKVYLRREGISPLNTGFSETLTMNTAFLRHGFSSAVLATALAAFLASPAVARNQIRIVGSSTVFPFSTVVAEFFGRTTDFRTPVVESTGTGGGFKLFCGGVGEDRPDFVNAAQSHLLSNTDVRPPHRHYGRKVGRFRGAIPRPRG